MILTATFYQFAELPDAAALRQPLLRECEARKLRGTVLLASEGINGTISGTDSDVRALLDRLRAVPGLASLQQREAVGETLPFRRMKVRLKREIVTFGVAQIDPRSMAGRRVDPRHWNALIARPDVVVIDVRNHYEIALGRFERAVDPDTRSFSELPGWIERERSSGGMLCGTPQVAMYCTGGIRCEKSTAHLRAQGIEDVFHLQGGILNYLETVPEAQSLWRGECFVFDDRTSIGHAS